MRSQAFWKLATPRRRDSFAFWLAAAHGLQPPLQRKERVGRRHLQPALAHVRLDPIDVGALQQLVAHLLGFGARQRTFELQQLLVAAHRTQTRLAPAGVSRQPGIDQHTAPTRRFAGRQAERQFAHPWIGGTGIQVCMRRRAFQAHDQAVRRGRFRHYRSRHRLRVRLRAKRHRNKQRSQRAGQGQDMEAGPTGTAHGGAIEGRGFCTGRAGQTKSAETPLQSGKA